MATRYRARPRRNLMPWFFWGSQFVLWGGYMALSWFFQFREDPAAAMEKLEGVGYAMAIVVGVLGPYFWWLEVRRPDEL